MFIYRSSQNPDHSSQKVPMAETILPLLQRIDSEFARSFTIAARTSLDLQCRQEGQKAAKRAIALGPNCAPILDLFPEYTAIITEIDELLLRQTQVLQSDPENAKSHEICFFCYLSLGNFPFAFRELKKCADSDEASFCYAAGVVYAYYARLDSAVCCLEKLRSFDGDGGDARDLDFRLAIVERSAKNFDGARERLERLLKAPPKNLTVSDIRFQIGYTLELSGKFDEACRVYEELHGVFPVNEAVAEQMVLCKYLRDRAGDLTQTKALLAKVSGIHPRNPLLLLVSAWIDVREHERERAYGHYRACLPYFRDSPYFWCALASMYYHNQQCQDAVTSFQRALYLKNNLPEAWLNIGLIAEESSDFAGAMKVYQNGKSHCATEREFDDRIETLRTQRAGHRKYGVGNSFSEIDESYAVVPTPEEFASDYLRSVPRLFAPTTGLNGTQTTASLDDLSSVPESLFV
jgi:tetratricopeptide (TPR) repeat protein